jgi:hypothetical protein
VPCVAAGLRDAEIRWQPIEAAPDKRTCGTWILEKGDAAVRQEKSRLDPADGVLNQRFKLFTLLVLSFLVTEYQIFSKADSDPQKGARHRTARTTNSISFVVWKSLEHESL